MKENIDLKEKYISEHKNIINKKTSQNTKTEL